MSDIKEIMDDIKENAEFVKIIKEKYDILLKMLITKIDKILNDGIIKASEKGSVEYTYISHYEGEIMAILINNNLLCPKINNILSKKYPDFVIEIESKRASIHLKISSME